MLIVNQTIIQYLINGTVPNIILVIGVWRIIDYLVGINYYGHIEKSKPQN